MFLVNWLAALTPYGNLQDVIFEFLQTPLLSLGNTLGAMSIAYLFLHFFWFFGINGGSVLAQSLILFCGHCLLKIYKHLKTVMKFPTSSLDNFKICLQHLGAGSTLSLIIVMVLFCKSQRIKSFRNFH